MKTISYITTMIWMYVKEISSSFIDYIFDVLENVISFFSGEFHRSDVIAYFIAIFAILILILSNGISKLLVTVGSTILLIPIGYASIVIFAKLTIALNKYYSHRNPW